MGGKTSNKRVSAEKSFSLKDRLFNAETLGLLTAGLARACPRFDAAAFKQEVLPQFRDLELKACIDCMADALVTRLPESYPEAVKILVGALPEPLDPNLADDDFGQFIWAVPSEFAARQGCTKKRLKSSLSLLKETTKRFSAEFAIRPFLKEFAEETYDFLTACALDKNYHVRRLASEGIRPMLPWGLRIDLSVEQTLAMLTTLHADPTRFVTRSVANNLNDISKTAPDDVLKVLAQWKNAARQTPEELDWMARHALRGLVKADHPAALAALGYPTDPQFKLGQIVLDDTVTIGSALVWSATLTSLSKRAEQKLKIFLRVQFLKANGSYSAKVFALKDISLRKGEAVKLKKKLQFKPMTTRALYPGVHHVELVVNGVACGMNSFVVEA